jgi:sRNA-binding regulator protein Hfq
MRIELGEPAWLDAIRQRKRVRIFLNGSQLDECVTADDELGFAICFARDEWGNLIEDHAAPAYELRRGLVRIIIESAEARS